MSNGRHGGKTFLNRENAVAHTRTDGIERNDGIAHRLLVNREGLDEKDDLTFVAGLLLGSDDLSDDFSENHENSPTRWTSSTIATIVASVGTSRPLNAKEASFPRHT